LRVTGMTRRPCASSRNSSLVKPTAPSGVRTELLLATSAILPVTSSAACTASHRDRIQPWWKYPGPKRHDGGVSGPESRKRRGRRPGGEDTRAALITAARDVFAEAGHEGATGGGNDQPAGVAPALVH